VTFPQAIGSKPVWVDNAVLWWTFTYQPVVGIEGKPVMVMVVVTLAFPEASA